MPQTPHIAGSQPLLYERDLLDIHSAVAGHGAVLVSMVATTKDRNPTRCLLISSNPNGRPLSTGKMFSCLLFGFDCHTHVEYLIEWVGWLFAYLVGSAVGGPILFPVFLSKIDVLLRVTTTCLCQAIETEIKKFLAPSETGPQFFLFTDRLFNFFFFVNIQCPVRGAKAFNNLRLAFSLMHNRAGDMLNSIKWGLFV